jgi:sugar phosphate isomerase/epimerase
MINRRRFLQYTGSALAATVASDVMADVLVPAKRNWGVQLFSIPQMVANDFPGTLKKLRDYGYRELEFFGPYSFSAPATIERWVGLAQQMGIKQNAFYGYKVDEVKKMLKDNGLKSPSVHLDIITLRTNLAAAMSEFKKLGVKYVVIPTLMDERWSSADDFKRFAEEFNKLGKQMSDYGISFVFHNHGYEHVVLNGEVPMDILLKNTDPKYVTFELDIFWMQAAGASPIEYLQKYPGRFKLMHVKDAAEKVRFSGDGSTPDQWMAVFSKMADPGAGVFDIKGIIETAVASGTEHFFLERDLTPTPEATLKNSYQYLSGLK